MTDPYNIPTEDLICDFCSEKCPVPTKIYKANVQLSAVLYDKTNFRDEDLLWAACSVCTDIIERRQWLDLFNRGLTGTFLHPSPSVGRVTDNITPEMIRGMRAKMAIVISEVFGIDRIANEPERKEKQR